MKKQWQYLVVEEDDVLMASAMLNNFGSQRWELVTVKPLEFGRSMYYFKRPVYGKDNE